MIPATLRTNKGTMLTIDSKKDYVVQHFANPQSYAYTVLGQINEGLYDPFFKGLKEAVIVDVGANIGLVSIYAQEGQKCVYALEPTPAHFKVLRELTKGYLNVKPLQVALTSSDGTVPFHLHEGNTTMNSLIHEGEKTIPVSGICLETLFRNESLNSVDFIKIDIEGGEIDVLHERQILAVCGSIEFWFIECHDDTRPVLKDRFARCGVELIEYRHDCLISPLI